MVDLNPGDGGRGGANLKRYWLVGEGALKIRWNTPGDWERCYRHIGKHVNPEFAKRICAQWHHEATGIWPGHHGGDNPNGPG